METETKTKRPRGAQPIWTEDMLEEAKELYLDLLRLGKTEYQIDVVPDLPGHAVRNKWIKDQGFAQQVAQARADGAVHILEEAEKKQQDAYERALDDAASPQLVAVINGIMNHARWKASKYNKSLFGEQSTTKLVGDKENPVQIDSKIEIILVSPENVTN